MAQDYADIPDDVLPRDIVIDGRKATILHTNDFGKPVPPDEAAMAYVVFDDGGHAITRVTHAKQ